MGSLSFSASLLALMITVVILELELSPLDDPVVHLIKDRFPELNMSLKLFLAFRAVWVPFSPFWLLHFNLFLTSSLYWPSWPGNGFRLHR